MFGGDDDLHADCQIDQRRLRKLEMFYKAVAYLTLNHDTLSSSDSGVDEDYAVVFPNKLCVELEKVDLNWTKGGYDVAIAKRCDSENSERENDD